MIYGSGVRSNVVNNVNKMSQKVVEISVENPPKKKKKHLKKMKRKKKKDTRNSVVCNTLDKSFAAESRLLLSISVRYIIS